MIRVELADLAIAAHQDAVRAMTAMYARDEMGNGGELPTEVMERLVPALRAHPTTMVFLAFDGEEPVGIATCFLGFSTFAAKPLINIHDFAVHPDYRGRRVSSALVQAVEAKARELGCVKLTLEVQSYNQAAQRAYSKFGFKHGEEGQFAGPLFLNKRLS